jgi:hypothetical protein
MEAFMATITIFGVTLSLTAAYFLVLKPVVHILNWIFSSLENSGNPNRPAGFLESVVNAILGILYFFAILINIAFYLILIAIVVIIVSLIAAS